MGGGLAVAVAEVVAGDAVVGVDVDVDVDADADAVVNADADADADSDVDGVAATRDVAAAFRDQKGIPPLVKSPD